MGYRYCLGCSRNKDKLCIIKNWKNAYDCPCGECLIKPMCKTSCNERKEIIAKILDDYVYKEITYSKTTIPREI